MRIDCGTCAVRGAACADCVVTFLTIGVRDAGDRGVREDAPQQRPEPAHARTLAVVPPTAAVDLDDAERAAIAVLASSGLVPPLRLTPGPSSRTG